MQAPDHADYFRREPRTDDPRHTMILNLKEAVKHIRGDIVLMIEDDEFYSPKYFETMAAHLERFEIVGIGRSKYFHLGSGKYTRHWNLGHASLAQTAFQTSFLPNVLRVLEGDSFLDIRIWKNVNGPDADRCDARNLREMSRISKDKRGFIFDDGDDCLYLGIKGLPGRPGIGAGHRQRKITNPQKKEVLKRLIPRAYPYYLPFMDGKLGRATR